MTSKYSVDYLSNHLFYLTEILDLRLPKTWLIFHKGNSKENLEKNSSVALLSPACLFLLTTKNNSQHF